MSPGRKVKKREETEKPKGQGLKAPVLFAVRKHPGRAAGVRSLRKKREGNEPPAACICAERCGYRMHV